MLKITQKSPNTHFSPGPFENHQIGDKSPKVDTLNETTDETSRMKYADDARGKELCVNWNGFNRFIVNRLTNS